jgi:dTDP-4-dehydrorhamnose 3,5-epimerase
MQTKFIEIEGAVKAQQTVDDSGKSIAKLIDGVMLREGRNIMTRNGTTVELFRPEWGLGMDNVKHIIRVALNGRAISAWHCHRIQTDHVAVIEGICKGVLYDGRENSPTSGMVNAFSLGETRPQLLKIPPGVWHGFQNMRGEVSAFINYFDRPFCYEDPDEWSLPHDSDKIPFQFST